MTKYREILRLLSLGISERKIAESCGVSRNTVSRIRKRADEIGLKWPLDTSQTDKVLETRLYPKGTVDTNSKRMPDYEYIRKELLKNGVTKKLLWTEYLEECRQSGENPLMYSQFCYHIQQNEQKRRATILRAHIHMYEFFGGVPPILVPDNASTATDRKQSDWYTPKLNQTYHEMAEHYNTAIIPARVRRPKDKPVTEGSVGNISTWITAALRNEQFFSLSELNIAIRDKLRAFNSKNFQKKEGSRISIFLGEEKPLLMPLPAIRYELATWKKATVQFNYHVAVDKMYYSVPHQYIKDEVDVRMTDHVIEVFYKHERIASHKRLKGRPGQYSTFTEHMPDDHRKYLEWDGDRFRRWAKEIGPKTSVVIDRMLTSGRIEQQSYRACMAVMKLAEKHSRAKLEAVCTKALKYANAPSYKNIKNLFATMKPEEFAELTAADKKDIKVNPHGLTRGARYYGGVNHAE